MHGWEVLALPSFLLFSFAEEVFQMAAPAGGIVTAAKAASLCCI
ncbi:hypothetical protein IOMTU133_1115 [Pseudomonas aeruginosa]|nr:hypothetical protein IOMTU133_1115 [Pseudomonas aeruginosa]